MTMSEIARKIIWSARMPPRQPAVLLGGIGKPAASPLIPAPLRPAILFAAIKGRTMTVTIMSRRHWPTVLRRRWLSVASRVMFRQMSC